ncbi:DNA polymerase III subunit gamma and tau [Cutibacterium sp. WCA-380-WT-3A]|uniref:DNA-directed DNA polymerase n=1 Tax=Cutibacterium porci TaxID=2605781 RepID=A0A7K0J4M5_9ACTN|nr:DNA polymerase III subunit gamma and tau [Cutibacterium porci]MSS44885.1 DNA polymerase III subunit gamma and tau [Cutibacterium porci]
MEDEAVEPEVFEQGGPDLFGDEESPRPVVLPDEATPDDDLPSDSRDPGLLDGPETPDEPDGLETDEDVDDSADVTERVQELIGEAPDSNTDGDFLEPPLALYRRYRPETFDEVIGEDHVIEPLKRAILNNRVNHAYLFSGPRGCGKTTTARILARALNCEQGPTPTPCGTCQSCRDLACGGPGSIDVIEIDAASHGGVDDARDLRERAFFAPVHSRYKIYIIDEAHMVTPQGFNALLKLVEEPPPHVKFIFATTEPEKVIGTIRSRTHHYPFRLVPPKVLVDYLAELCGKEGIDVDHAVLPLVVRAGGGSVRDSLSVLDQLLGGAADGHVSYEQAAALLGYTPEALLDEIVDAFAAGDAHQVFATIDKVIEVGQDPRRFAEDLLRRMRDLVIISAVPDACRTGLIDVSPEQGIRLTHQVAGFGAGELTRAAEVLATGLTNMRGTTAPRLHLELMCSRILLPAADTDGRGIHARLERLERRIGVSGPVDDAELAERATPAQPVSRRVDAPQQAGSPQHRPAERPSNPEGRSAQTHHDATSGQRPSGRPRPSRKGYRPGNQLTESSSGEPGNMPQGPGWSTEPSSSQHQPSQQDYRGVSQPQQSSDHHGGDGAIGAIDVTTLRREWPQVLEAVKDGGRVAWMVLSKYAQVLEAHGNQATLGFSHAGARENFVASNYPKILHDAVVKVLGVDLTFTAVVGEPPAAVRPEPHSPEPHRAQPQPAETQPREPDRPEPQPVVQEPPDDDPWTQEPYSQGPVRGDGPPDPTDPGRNPQDRPGNRRCDDTSGHEPDPSASSHPSEDDSSVPDATTEDQYGDIRDEVVEAGPVAGAPDPDSGEAADPEPDLVPGGDHVEAAEHAEAGATRQSGGSSQRTVSVAEGSTAYAGGNTGQSGDTGQSGTTGHEGGHAHRWSERAKGSVRPLEMAARPVRAEEPPNDDGDWDDTVVEESAETPIDLIMRELGGVVIDTGDDPTVR